VCLRSLKRVYFCASIILDFSKKSVKNKNGFNVGRNPTPRFRRDLSCVALAKREAPADRVLY